MRISDGCSPVGVQSRIVTVVRSTDYSETT